MATGTEIAHGVATGIGVLAKIATVEKNVMPYATFIAGFFPGAASILSAIAIAQPWIDKAVAAAPAIEAGIEAGAPIIDAINQAGPQVLTHIKTAIAVLSNADPEIPGTAMTAADVTDGDAVAAAGPLIMGRRWTQAETQRFWDKADGTSRDGLGNRTDRD